MIDFISDTEKAKQYDNMLDATVKNITGSVEGMNYRLYQHASDARDVVIVFHGGGVNHQDAPLFT